MKYCELFVGFALAGLSVAPWEAQAAPPASPELIAKGKAVFATTCVPCHGELGDGAGPAAAALEPKPRNFGEPFKNGDKPENVMGTLTTGLPGTAMVTFAALAEEDRWALTYYVLELRQTLSKASAAKAKPAPPKKK